MKRLAAGFVAALIGSAVTGCAVSAAAAARTCSRTGAVYAPQPPAAAGRIYRLRIENLPRSDVSAAVANLWRFQVLDTRGRKLTELRMLYSCAAGPGPCTVSAPSRPNPDGGYASEVVQLDRDFAPTEGDRAPYAIVLPAFPRNTWLFAGSEQSMPDLTFFTPDRVLPDLGERQVWLLTGCERASRASSRAVR